MKVMVLSGNKLEEKDITNDLDTLKEIVGGWIETPMISEKLHDNAIIPIVNEEGKFIDGLKPEIAVCRRDGLILDVVFGNVIFAGFDGSDDFTDLTEKQIKIIKNELQQMAMIREGQVRVLWMN